MASFITTAEVLAVAQSGALGKKGHQSVSKVAEADFLAGVFVTIGSDTDDGAAAPTSTGEVADVLGVTRLIATHENGGAADEHWGDNEAMEIVYEGFIYVQCEETVVAGDPVFIRYATGAGGTVFGHQSR